MDVSITDAAKSIGVSRKTLSKIIKKKGKITPEMAVRLSIALGSSPESWMGHQVTYDLWKIEQHKEKLNVQPIWQTNKLVNKALEMAVIDNDIIKAHDLVGGVRVM